VPRPAGDARKLKAIDVIDVLSDLFILQGIPAYIRSDNGPEFVAKAVQEWLAREAAWMARWRPLSFFFRGRRGVGDRREHHELPALTDEEYSAADEQPAGTDNAFIESFNGKFRAECLNAHWFMSLDDARRKCETWRRDYNEERSHSAIGNKAPIELIDRSVAYGPR
jgi:putative transposase